MACLDVAWASRIAENWGLTGASDHGCRGLEVRLIAQMSVNGTPRVTSVTHTLYRFPRKRSGAAKSRHDQDVPPSTSTKELRFTQSATMRYADASGDHNPIHTSPLLARAFGFRGAIAHGMHTLARCVGVRARPVVLVVLICGATVPACSCVAQLRARAAIPPTLQNEQQLRLHCTFHKPAVLPCTTVFASYPSTTVRGAASAPQATVANGVLTAGDGWDTSNGVLPALPGLVTCTAFDLRSAKRTSDVHVRGGVALSGV